MLLLYLHKDILQYVLNLYLFYEYEVPILEKIIGSSFTFDIKPHSKIIEYSFESCKTTNIFVDDKLVNVQKYKNNKIKFYEQNINHNTNVTKVYEWFDSGKIWHEAILHNHKFHGVQIYYNEDGTKKEVKYENGNLIN
jgi:antitoxin component YwqK of YwqJK toxin-antitoxin module